MEHVVLLARQISVDEVVAGLGAAEPVEDYPQYFAGPAVLVLFVSNSGTSLHALWGIERNTSEPAVLITAYAPDHTQWSDDFRTRKT